MYKVIIVDDESLVCMGIRACLNWEATEFILAGEASDGEEALALVRSIKPDIVLTDIRMPKMDGIELLTILQKEYPETKVIILSCLNEMEIVKKTLKMGAFDYILKLSLKPEELFNILNTAKAAIIKEKNEKKRISYMEDVLKSNRKMVGSYLFQKVILNELELSELNDNARDFHVDVGFESVILLYTSASAYEVDDIDLVMKIPIILDKVLADNNMGKYYYFQYSAGVVAVIEGGADANSDKWLHSLADKATKMNLPISFGISETCIGFAILQTQAKQAKEAWKHSFYYDGSMAFLYNSCESLPDKKITFTEPVISKIEDYIASAQYKKVEEYIDDYVLKQLLEIRCQPQNVRKWCQNFCYEIVQHLRQLYGDDINQLNGLDFFSDINELSNIYQIFEYIKVLIGRIVEAIVESPKGPQRKEIVLAKKYVQRHMSENFTLNDVASFVALSRSHFSMLFKQEQGESFTAYVNRVKMEYARQLLSTQKIHVYEAANMVGIDNENYFSKLFKRIIGVSPSTVSLADDI